GGGCGACTVMVSRYNPREKTISHFSANACLLPVCQLHLAAVTTTEGIGSTETRIHPVQERIAKANGSQCGFCTPGMVMSLYALLRNQPQPSLEDIVEALGGNLCRCTGYRPIVDGCKTFCGVRMSVMRHLESLLVDNAAHQHFRNVCACLFHEGDLLPQDPTQELIFPPELMLMAESQRPLTQTFCGERITWVSPVTLRELVELKAKHPKAPLVLGNTGVGLEMKFKGILHPVIISPTRVPELYEVNKTPDGVWVGAACSLTSLKTLVEKLVRELHEDQVETFSALLQQLRSLGGQQIRNVASLGGNIASAAPNSDLNPVLAAGRCILSVISKGEQGRREIAVNEDFFVGFGKTALKQDEIILSVFIPVSKRGEFVRAFRQAPRKANALATVTSGMRVRFAQGTDAVEDLAIFYGGVGPCTVGATKTCREVIGRRWNEETLNEAYRLLLDEISLPPSAPGGKVEFRRSLTLSFLFKFNLQMLQKLNEMFSSLWQVRPDCSDKRRLTFGTCRSQEVSQGQRGDDLVGRPVMHRSALSQATGEAVYCDDIAGSQGELFLALVTSTRAHAKLIKIDDGEALKLPGVVDAVTAKDIPGKKFRTFTGIDEELLAENEVTCVGQMVGAVVADTRQHAKQGAAAVKVVYEDLPDRVLTIEEAIEKKSFFKPQREIERGNVTEGFRKADQMLEGEIRIGGQEHFYMETQSMLVVPSGEEKELKVSHRVHLSHISIAETLGIPSNRVSCHVKRMGGAFGGKVTKTSILASITALAAWKTGQAVRCVLERGDDMLITGARHPVLANYKVGFMNDGRIIAADIQYFTNAGNTGDESILVIEKILLHIDNAYSVPNLRGRATACKTNLPSNTAFRGFGVPQSMLVVESVINDVAMKLGCTAEEIREKNMYKGPSITHYKLQFDPENLLRCWDECLQKADYHSRRTTIAQFNQSNRFKKRGIAVIPIKYGIAFAECFLNQAAALVHIYKDGSVLVSHGGAEMGQGIHTKMQQVASRELRIPVSLIHISETSTNVVPNTCPSAASFGTDANGMAVKMACETLLQRLEPVIREDPKGTWQSWIKAAFFKKIGLSATGYYRGPDTYMDWKKQEGQPYAYFTYGTCCSEVEVDCLTGDYQTLRTDIVMDIGRSINPSIDIGQIEGAFMQGLGLYTMEERKFSPSGMLYPRGPAQYKIPAVCDMPLKFNVYLLAGSSNLHAIYSSKGIGEPVLFLGSSVFFAIKDAVAAARKDVGLGGPFKLDSPACPEETCLACASCFVQMVPVPKPGSFQPWAIDV
uniref:Aldehyde oxidase 6 n=1 Tax=Scleropages formosus TaxID=113540 RepID=A0A8C9VGJ1_SCLFO